MIECNINNIKKSYGANLIFENISFSVQSGERIGLIGPNGCGKTTLLKILNKQENIAEGEVTFKKGTHVGYLDQIPDLEDGIIVEDILLEAKKDVMDLKKEIDDIAKQLQNKTGKTLERLLDTYSDLIHDFEQKDGYLVETTINKVCTGLKISDDMRKLSFSVLSGGEKTRVMLAKILLENPSLLLLDEPSNHLDLESIEWLENYLKEYQGSVIIVSHDRYFLDNVCQKIVELSINRAIVYHGNYSYYVIERERRFLLELKAYLALEKQTKRMEEQIKRYRIWGEMRDSDKMFKRAKELEKRLSKIEPLDKPVKEHQKMKLNHGKVMRSGKRVLEAKNIKKQFDDLVIFKNAHVDVIYQDHLAILGPNGSGKTTLLNMLLNDYHKEEPMFKWGSNIKIGYLPQEVTFDNEKQTIIDFFMDKHHVNQAVARRELAKALFVKDDVFKQIDMLSGGEKSKLMLCSLTYDEVNLMILDEPTNHLDIDSRETLEEMLMDYQGTLLFISHDRYFINKIATRIGEIQNYKIKYYEGDFSYYKLMKQKEQEEKQKKKDKKTAVRVKQKPIEHRDIISEIEEIENQVNEIDIKMNADAFDNVKLLSHYEKKEELLKTLTKLYSLLEEQDDI